MSFSPVRLNHAVLFVADLDRSLRFYTDLFGMQAVAREPRPTRRSSAFPARATITTSACSASAPPADPNVAARSASTTWPGSSTPSTSWQQPAKPCSTPAPTPANPATEPPRASTAPTPTATSSNSCGCSPATSGARTRTPPPPTTSTSPARCSDGAASPPPDTSPPTDPASTTSRWMITPWRVTTGCSVADDTWPRPHAGERRGDNMGVLRRHRDDDSTVHFKMREKLMSIGDDYWIETDDGVRMFRVNGKAMRLRDTWKLEDAEGRDVATIRERKLSIRDAIKIEVNGTEATVKKAMIGIRDRFHVEVDGGKDLKVHGNIVDHEYEIERDGDKIAEVSKKWFRVARHLRRRGSAIPCRSHSSSPSRLRSTRSATTEIARGSVDGNAGQRRQLRSRRDRPDVRRPVGAGLHQRARASPRAGVDRGPTGDPPEPGHALQQRDRRHLRGGDPVAP